MSSIYPTSSTSSADTLRISGMASGIDTDEMVKSMVSSYQSKIDKANQEKQTLAWQQEGYRDIIKDIKGLQDYFDPLSSKYMLSGNSLNINTVASDEPSVITATSGSTAQAGNYKVSVQQLAEQARIDGTALNSIVDVADATAESAWSGVELTINNITLDPLDATTNTNTNDTSLDEIVANINSKIAKKPTLNGIVSASYVSDANGNHIKFTNTSSASLSLAESTSPTHSVLGTVTSINSQISSSSELSDLGVADMGFSLSYDAATTTTPIVISATSTDTIQVLMDKVKSATSGVVTMSLDDTTGKISFQSKNYGSTSNLEILDITGDTSKLGIAAETVIGKDAIVAITSPGQSMATTTTQSSNTFTVNGVNYNLAGVSALNDTSNVTVTANSDTVVTNVKEFIEEYNTVISTINTKLAENNDRDYAPLTDAQKKAMSEEQITTWETKAKAGVLRNDSYLSSLLTQLRGTLYAPVYNIYDSADTSTGKIALNFGSYGLNSIGIETSNEYTDAGKLVIKDEAKLKNAIENNMDEFKKIFIGASSSTLDTTKPYIGSENYNEDGIFKRMDTIMRDYVAAPGVGKDGTFTLSGYMNIFVNKQYDYSKSGTSGKNTLPDQVYSKTLNVSKFQAQLEAASTRYYAKFTALETAMNALNTQQSSLASMLGTG
ncbi:flagellar filament capping protein FliD [Clostridium sp.]|jgi:flagellar hook-associated protein 2|uniref:flagellar filament capping protein FliD n=1 Tax=Clostridium sp. TaxID=1506 RepID=UPI003EEAA909